jgi:PilZ domain-containing protein
MNRRLDERYQTNLAVTVTDIAAQDRVATGRIINISEAGVCAHLSMCLAPGTVVKAELEDCVLFGHVTYCDAEQAFRTGIEVVRVLIGESDLSRLVNAILAETMPTLPGLGAVAQR